jgi:hypothetical protein
VAKPKLNQVIAVAAGRKADVAKVINELHHMLQKESLFDGISRTYKPRAEDGESLPSESRHIQKRAKELIKEATDAWSELFDITLTLDRGNCQARADVIVDGKVIVRDVPVTTLLFLEKQLHDVVTFVSKLPMPDPASLWEYDQRQDCLATVPTQTVRTKKVPKAFVKYEATKEHPAQVEVFHEDVVVGDWTTILYTGRISAGEKNEILVRLKKLQDAVKVARETANSIEVEPQKMGESVFQFVFGSQKW